MNSRFQRLPRREAVEAFFREHHKLFGLSNSLAELKVRRERTDKNTYIVWYEQIYEDLNVFDHGATCDFNPTTSAIRVATAHIAQITRPLRVALPADPTAAVQAARAEIEGKVEFTPELRPNVLERVPAPLLGIVVRDGEPRPTWKIVVLSVEAAWVAFVDAETNRVLSVANETIYG